MKGRRFARGGDWCDLCVDLAVSGDEGIKSFLAFSFGAVLHADDSGEVFLAEELGDGNVVEGSGAGLFAAG